MELFASLAGNEKIKKTLASDILKEKPAHAYIIEGARGNGKHTAAYLAAAALFCEDRNSDTFPCGKCRSCKKTFGKINADVTVISRGSKATLGVDSIRLIKESLHLAPVEMKHKVYIIEEADKMTKSAQNALLLSLEEPPEYVMFLLLCEDSSPLLDTVKSRAPVLRCESFSADFIKSYLSSDPLYAKYAAENPQSFGEACVAAAGSIGDAKLYLNQKQSKEIHAMRERAESALKALCYGAQSERIASAFLYPSARAELADFLKLVQLALRDLLYVKKNSGSSFLFFTDFESAQAVAVKVSTRRLCALEASLRRAINDINANLSINAVLTLLVTG